MLRMLYKNSKRRPTFDGSLVFVYETLADEVIEYLLCTRSLLLSVE